MGLPATKRTNLHEKYGASANAGNVSACRATGFQSKAHQSARKVRLPQEATAATQASRLLGDRYLRLNHDAAAGQPAFERLDLASDAARTALMSAGQDIAQRAYVEHRAFIDRMLSGLRAN